MGWKRWVVRVSVTLLLLLLLPLLREDNADVSPLARATAPYRFSLEGWILQNLPSKWIYQLRQLLPGQSASQEERGDSLQEYFSLGDEVRQLQGELGRRAARSASPGDEPITELEDRLDRLTDRRNDLRPLVEDTLERKLSAVLKEQGLRWKLGPFQILFPPVDLRLDRMPDLLAISPRDRIGLTDTRLLQGGLTLGEKEALEEAVLVEQELSALVVGLGGLAAYPTIISPTQSHRAVLDTMAHEWLHQYWFFHPLGFSYNSSAEMTTLNETAADIAGRELGELVFQRIREQLSLPSSPASWQESTDFDFSREMRQTRLQVDALLGQGRVEEAERYMEEQRLLFVENGYNIRKLNQAYFAFNGTYAESPASVSPIAGQLHHLRERSLDLGAFVRTVAGFGSYKEFLAYLEELVGMVNESPSGAEEASR